MLDGLINIEPDGYGGGFGAIDGFGVAQFGVTNIWIPLNYLIIAAPSWHLVQSPELDTFIQIFNMIKTGDYIKDFEAAGQHGSEYTKDTGTMPVKQGYFGRITPEADSNLGFLVVKTGSSGSYNNNGINSGIINITNRGQGSLSTEVQDTGVYTKDNNNQGEYEV